VGSAVNLLIDRLWTEVELPRRARRAGADVIHHPLPARGRRAACAQVVTVHDLAFVAHPELFDARFRRYAALAHRGAVRAADAVVCVSHATAAELARHWGVGGERVVVAHHGPGQIDGAGAGGRRGSGPAGGGCGSGPAGGGRGSGPAGGGRGPRPTGGGRDAGAGEPCARQGRHLLYVGDDEPRKNLGLALAAHARYRAACEADGEAPVELVLAGAARRDGPGVRCEPTPTPARLAELYAGAMALVHPARHEGFGLTALEAMAAGAPVLAARCPAVVEVCGQAARYVEPDDADGLAGLLRAVGRDAGLRERMSADGLRRAQAFSWGRSARAHIEAYTLARG
jgi:glycosyltransferase involved in cell wall biosynthesis